MPLLEFHAEDLLDFGFGRNIGRVNLQNAICALLFCFEESERVVVIARRDDSVRDFLCDELSRCLVALVRKRNEVAETAHSVSSSSSRIRTGERGEFNRVVNKVDFFERVRKPLSDCSSCGAYMLEARCGGKPRCFF